MKNLKMYLYVVGDTYMPDPEKDKSWFEYRVSLMNKEQILDEWDSIDSFNSTGNKLTLKQAEDAIQEIENDVKNGLATRWFNHPILI